MQPRTAMLAPTVLKGRIVSLRAIAKLRRALAAGIAFALIVLSAESATADDEALIAAAQKEGSVVWYTTQIINPLVLALTSAFEKKYDVRVDYVRANASEIVLRLADEARAGKTVADVYDGTTVGEALKRQGLAERWLPDDALTFPPDYRDPDGYWVAQNFYVITAAFNTNLIPAGREPKNWNDLLDPKYRGQIAWAGSASVSAGAGFVGIVLKQLGDEKGRAYLAKLARQKIAAIDAAARVVVDQLIAGEYALGLQIFPEHADESAAKGAPVKWIAMEPGMSAIVSTTGIVKSPPHPNAARLFLAYMISEEGQKIFRDAFYNPANPKVSPLDADLAPGRNHLIFLTPGEVVDAMPQWMKTYNEFFR